MSMWITVFNPPICPVIGSAFPGIEAASSYMIRVLQRLQCDSIRSLSVKIEAQNEFNEWAQSRMTEMAFTGNCKSWCEFPLALIFLPTLSFDFEHVNTDLGFNAITDKNSKGKVFIPWPGTIAHYIQCIDTIRWEDFDFVWANAANKYSSFGNGVPIEGVAPEVPPWLTKPDIETLKIEKNGIP